MDKTYWIGRKRASLKLARNAIGPEARLIHYDLAGRYSLKALSAETLAIDLAEAIPPAIQPRAADPAPRDSDAD